MASVHVEADSLTRNPPSYLAIVRAKEGLSLLAGRT